jgi:hypothetical protein
MTLPLNPGLYPPELAISGNDGQHLDPKGSKVSVRGWGEGTLQRKFPFPAIKAVSVFTGILNFGLIFDK